MKKEIKEIKEIAIHSLSDTMLIGDKFVLDASAEEMYLGGNSRYEDVVDIVGVDDDAYDADDCEQDHDEDYAVREYSFTITYDEAEGEDYEAEYATDKSSHDDGRDTYYGYCGGNRKEFSAMYGDGNYMGFAEWIIKNKKCEITIN